MSVNVEELNKDIERLKNSVNGVEKLSELTKEIKMFEEKFESGCKEIIENGENNYQKLLNNQNIILNSNMELKNLINKSYKTLEDNIDKMSQKNIKLLKIFGISSMVALAIEMILLIVILLVCKL